MFLRCTKFNTLYQQKINLLCTAYRNFKEESHKDFNALTIVELYGMISGMEMANNDFPFGIYYHLKEMNEELSVLSDWFDDIDDNNRILQLMYCEAWSYLRDK